MKKARQSRPAVTLRTKGNKRRAKLDDNPAFRELARMMDAGEIDGRRTLAHLKAKPRPDR